MAKPRYSYTVNFEREDAEAVEQIAYDSRMTPTAVIKAQFLERLKLVRAGWILGDDKIGNALRAIVRLKGQKLEQAIQFIEKL